MRRKGGGREPNRRRRIKSFSARLGWRGKEETQTEEKNTRRGEEKTLEDVDCDCDRECECDCDCECVSEGPAHN